MTASPQQHRQCAGKIRYERQDRAYAALKTMVPRRSQDPKLNVYRCPWCRAFHVGHRS